jgi:hypothetical protein
MSTVEMARAYLRERYPSRRFVPLAFLVAGAGILASAGLAHMTVASLARAGLRGITVAYLLILVFRIWDDLEDRERDAVLHPGRITTRATATGPLIAVLSGASIIAAALVFMGPQPILRLMALAALTLVISVWYGARGAINSAPVANALVVLSKYPVIAVVVAPATLWAEPDVARAAPFLLALYLFLCIHEALDDPILRRSLGRGSPT